jgi:Uri superfamily endonuclease
MASLNSAPAVGQHVLPSNHDHGVYTLMIQVIGDLTLKVGSLGTLTFTEGWYTYSGSAFGLQGLARIERHLSKKKKLFWHIDYLLESPCSTISAVVYAKTEEKSECKIVGAVRDALQGWPISGFGSSDCRMGCGGHLLYVLKKHFILKGVVKAYQTLGLVPFTLIVKNSKRE